MIKFILGKKLEMSQIFKEDGSRIPVTWIEAGPCYVVQKKTKEKDGYNAVQIGFIKKNKNIKKTEKGKEFKHLKEISFKKEDESYDSIEPGSVIDVSVFEKEDKVKVSGTSKGKGFQGAVKRWGFKGKATSSHGTKHDNRTLGSTGSAFPERVIKGRKMPGRMGNERKTIDNLDVVSIDKENNLIAVRGAVPGPRGTLLEIKAK